MLFSKATPAISAEAEADAEAEAEAEVEAVAAVAATALCSPQRKETSPALYFSAYIQIWVAVKVTGHSHHPIPL